MRKNRSAKYTLILIAIMIFGSIFNFFSKKRNLALCNGQVLEIGIFVHYYPPNCRFQTKEGFDFVIQKCETLKIGEEYTIVGRVNSVTDKRLKWQDNLEVSHFYQNTNKRSLVSFYLGQSFANLEDFLLKGRKNLLGSLQIYFSGENLQLLTALTLGTRIFQFSPALKDEFSRAGLSHMVAVSGFHLGVVMTIVPTILNKSLGKKKAKFLFLPGMLIYILLVGSPLSIVRAGLMMTFSFIGRYFFYKQTKGVLILFLSFILMFNYMILNVFNVGFLLSFVATLGILLFAGEMTNMMDILSQYRGESISGKPLKWSKKTILKFFQTIAGLIGVSLAAQVLTLPITLLVFQKYAWWSILATVLFSGILVLIITLGICFVLFSPLANLSVLFKIILINPLKFYLELSLNLFYKGLNLYLARFGNIWELEDKIPVYYYYVYYFFWLLFVFYLYLKRRKKRVYVE